MLSNIAVYYDSKDQDNNLIIDKANYCSKFLNTKIINALDDSQYEFILLVKKDGLHLQYTPNKNFKPINIDFNDSKILYRLKFGGQYKEDIAKSCKVKGNLQPKILDTTAGFGVDSFILASLGCEVTLLEREPVIYLMLQDALERALKNDRLKPIAQKINLIHIDSINYLQNTENKKNFSVIYIDNMFPPRIKSAKVKKEIFILQMLLRNKIDDTKKLFLLALEYPQIRVVIKRPKLSSFIINKKPDIIFRGTSCRYDVYLSKQND